MPGLKLSLECENADVYNPHIFLLKHWYTFDEILFTCP